MGGSRGALYNDETNRTSAKSLGPPSRCVAPSVWLIRVELSPEDHRTASNLVRQWPNRKMGASFVRKRHALATLFSTLRPRCARPSSHPVVGRP